MTMTRPLPLAICCGDPCGVGAELIPRALKGERTDDPCDVGAELIPRVLKGERTHDPCDVGAELIPLKIRLKP